jgi:hypothetical protein
LRLIDLEQIVYALLCAAAFCPGVRYPPGAKRSIFAAAQTCRES